MGRTYHATCNNCGWQFDANDGPGMEFHLLHCDQCGKEKSISLLEIKKFEEENSDKAQEMSQSEIASELAGYCTCGGRYRIEAPPRCPRCHSDDIEEGEIFILYD